ncbi:MAG: peptide-methionine (S)-S-oxide reductase MsrA [Candidatus Thiodiazotropha lotti]|nr:peptide-methionine (S)-S-oxide reductase MsrA [Candidatus Thiodiazotropha lotti]MCG7923127.1 peptide-methionine (S)-S-oxide reductase MsrA [Candidatus Thiodiazotropha lotti]MCG7988877.1 peptide-methionine (S)-S-oxide reductase MsrA [Candidatus Thiodiazotropha lotti]MCG8002989.1 peptide-methionine (S)-S-oxide reductase MsrA [Candidatus Thiodiazotropha lotti]MCG8008617.1 peptide-methionine (S)-S-oxide reductase MsrA [Candidatus Thiodiazotropha lotti]
MKNRSNTLLILALLVLAPFQVTQANSQQDHLESIVLGMGCFWGAEKRMSALPGVVDVESGYANGEIEASYRKILSHESLRKLGLTDKRNHTEVVKITFDTNRTSLEAVLIGFWQNHDPTQGDRQGNDVGSNYRSAIYTHNDEQTTTAVKTRDIYQQALLAKKFGRITTEIAPLTNYTAAETYHQDYLVKNPNGYCGLGGTGVIYPGSQDSHLQRSSTTATLDGAKLDPQQQLVVFEAEECIYCQQFKADILDHWQAEVEIASTLSRQPPAGWKMQKSLIATPTIVLFEQGNEVSRFIGYNGNMNEFWQWFDSQRMRPEASNIVSSMEAGSAQNSLF